MTDSDRIKLIKKYAAPVPRYTSYPTAPNFGEDIGNKDYAEWLGALKQGARLSLYLHIPFCDTLCWFCGCNTKMVKRYDPVAEYLPFLYREIKNIAARVPKSHAVSHIHWGGGSPNILSEDDIARVSELIGNVFKLENDAEIAVEIDPRGLAEAQVEAYARSGVTRISVGVQDFSSRVQKAINRIQSFEETEKAINLFRDKGVSSINMDLIYGLPYQTIESTKKSVLKVLELEPDRIALFGYAHLPSRIKHQQMIDDDTLPDIYERFDQAETFATHLMDAGYIRIGLDHFAKPGDELVKSQAAGTLRRNFQGYTTDQADALLGLGASAIGQLNNAYVQNAVPTADYMRMVEDDGLAVRKGYSLTPDDMVRRYTIEQIMCNMELSYGELTTRFGHNAAPILSEAQLMLQNDSDGILQKTDEGFRVKEEGRPFLRTICANFDAHLPTSQARHAVGV